MVQTKLFLILYFHTERTILLRDLKFCWIQIRQNNFVGILKIMSNIAKNVDILATGLYNYFDSSTKLLF